MMQRVVVAGAGLAGARTVQQLRGIGYAGEIVLVGAEPHLPYDRPPLSKAVLHGTRDTTVMPFDLAALDVHPLLSTAASGLDLAGRQLLVTDSVTGRESAIPFDGLVIATGATPIAAPGSHHQVTLRTIDDAIALRALLTPGAKVVVIGGSWIGAEVATAALARGCTVTCVELAATPVAGSLGEDVGRRLASWWQQVDLRVNTAVEQVCADGVALADGTHLQADVAVAGIGVRPAVGWLSGSALRLEPGVTVDAWQRAAPGVVAIGDVAARWSSRYDCRLTVEHWDNAVSGSAHAAAAVLTGTGPDDVIDLPAYDPVPYFWSDQFGHKVQYVGHHSPAQAPSWREAGGERGWGAFWTDGDRITAALCVDRPKDLVAARRAVDVGATIDPGRLADARLPFAEGCSLD